MTKFNAKSLVVAGLSGGSGKSVVAVGLVSALRRSGKDVVAFKKGPDYIDAGWMKIASGRPCYNLDPFLMSKDAVETSFKNHLPLGGVGVIEGNRGLFDGVNPEGCFSTAELALELNLPILLVVNCTKATRTVAAMVLGCCMLEKKLRIGGVILNHIATARQESVVRKAVEQYSGVAVLGSVPRLEKDIFPMRHLGITPHQEYGDAEDAVVKLAEIISNNTDLDGICNLMQTVYLNKPVDNNAIGSYKEEVTIGVIRDKAFQFYYEENFEALRQLGGKLVMIDAFSAEKLPQEIDALYIGGGFPETGAAALADNTSFRHSVRENAEKGLPIYAECGGLIYLGRSIITESGEYPLTGVFPITFGISKKPQAHGYSIFSAESDNPFYPKGTIIKGHEFRYSTVLKWEGDPQNDLVLKLERGTGFMEKRDGLSKGNVLALYTHVIANGTPEWAAGLISAAKRFKREKELR